MTTKIEIVILDIETVIRTSNRRRQTPRSRPTVDRNTISEIAVPIIYELVVIDHPRRRTGDGAGIASKLDARSEEFREAAIIDSRISRRSLDIEALVLDRGHGGGAVGPLQRVEPALQGEVGKDEGTSRFAIDGEHALPFAKIVALDEIGAVSAGALDVNTVRREDLAREGEGPRRYLHRVAGQRLIDRGLDIGRMSAGCLD